MGVSWVQWSNEITKAIQSVPDETLLAAAKLIKSARLVLTAGNGGSHALASHAAQAFMKPDYKAGNGVPTVCLTDAVPTLTAHTNDAGWSTALEELARPFLNTHHFVGNELVLVVFSSSGKSENIIRLAKMLSGCGLVAFTGFDGGALLQWALINGVSIHVDSHDYEVVEPAHDALLHRVQYHLRTAVIQSKVTKVTNG